MDASQFFEVRVKSEHRARLNSTRQEVCLDDIYREFAHATGSNDLEVERIVAEEIELEESLLLPVPGAQVCLERLRHQGVQILFVSDTYHSGTVLKKWLQRHGLFKSGDRIWASCDAGTTKQSGDLYRDVLRYEKLEACNVDHLGDNREVDERRARELGIRSEWFEAGCLTVREALMEKHAQATAGAASLMAGASRYVRLKALEKQESKEQETLRRIAAETAGPVLTSFLVWVLQRCSDSGVRRILFAARDGQVLMRMAKPLADKLGLQLEMEYFYANRQLVNLAGLRELNEVALEWITAGAAVTSLEEFLQRVGLSLQDVAEERPEFLLPMEGPVGFANVGALREFMLRPGTSSRILAAAEARRGRMLDYFASVGLLSGPRCAVVDIGWRGRVFSSIASAIGRGAADRHLALYFGLKERPDPMPPGRQEAFLFDKRESGSVGSGHHTPGLTAAMEIFTQATHGQVLDIELSSNGVRPVLASASNEVGPTWDVPFFQKCLVQFASCVALDARTARAGGDLRPMCHELLLSLLRFPSREEARVFGSFEFTDGPNDATSSPLALPFKISDIWATLRHRRLPSKTYNWWEDGALMLTGPTTRWLLSNAASVSKRRPSLRPIINLVRARGAARSASKRAAKG